MTTDRQTIPQQRISPERRRELEGVHRELLHDAQEQEDAGHIYAAQVERAWAYDLEHQLGWI